MSSGSIQHPKGRQRVKCPLGAYDVPTDRQRVKFPLGAYDVLQAGKGLSDSLGA